MKYAAGFCCSTLVTMELFLPRFTDVLSTPMPTQLAQGISFLWNTSFIFANMDSAVPERGPAWVSSIILYIIQYTHSHNCNTYSYLPDVKHISSSCAVTLLHSTSKRRTTIGFIFSRPVSFDPSIAIENGLDFMVLTRVASKCGASDPFRMQVVFVRAEA